MQGTHVPVFIGRWYSGSARFRSLSDVCPVCLKHCIDFFTGLREQQTILEINAWVAIHSCGEFFFGGHCGCVTCPLNWFYSVVAHSVLSTIIFRVFQNKPLVCVGIIYCIHYCCIWAMCFTLIKFQLVFHFF